MDCPVCKNVTLVMSERQGIEIDYCPNCRGVWLDRGELDKIIDRSVGAPPPAAAPPGRSPDPRHAATGQGYAAPDPRFPPQGGRGQPYYPDRDHHYQHGQYPHHKKKKREGFLGELFDFD